MAILELREVSVRFGGHMAVNDLNIDVAEGEVTGLIGPNGAGKTTTFNVITGLQAPTRGEVTLDGRPITRVPAHRRSRLGLARTFQRLELFGSLTVRDNVLTAAELAADPRSAAERTDAVVDLIGLTDLAHLRADTLPTGSARLVELARAIATGPRVLLLDEPASGLDQSETDRFAELLGRLADEGLAVLLVEHDVPLVMELCRTITVLDFGRVLATGSPAEIRGNEAVADAYLGPAAGIGGAT